MKEILYVYQLLTIRANFVEFSDLILLPAIQRGSILSKATGILRVDLGSIKRIERRLQIDKAVWQTDSSRGTEIGLLMTSRSSRSCVKVHVIYVYINFIRIVITSLRFDK